MRTYGRIYDADNNPGPWVLIQTDAQGFNDYVWITTLCQTLKLNLGESPFFAQYGIPAKPSLVQQVFPDFYVYYTQRLFSAHFASLIIAKQPTSFPSYKINLTTNQGVKVPSLTVRLPQ